MGRGLSPLGLAGLILCLSSPVSAQITGSGGIWYGQTKPTTCSKGDVFASTSNGVLSICSALNTWLDLGGSSGETVPAGANILIDAGTCPAGYTENTALSGKTLIGTVAANGDVGTTGGSDAVTPAGTNANVSAGTPAGTVSQPTFTGTAWSAPAVSWPVSVPTFNGQCVRHARARIALPDSDHPPPRGRLRRRRSARAPHGRPRR